MNEWPRKGMEVCGRAAGARFTSGLRHCRFPANSNRLTPAMVNRALTLGRFTTVRPARTLPQLIKPRHSGRGPQGPRAGIHNPTPVVMDSGFAASLRYAAPRNDDFSVKSSCVNLAAIVRLFSPPQKPLAVFGSTQ